MKGKRFPALLLLGALLTAGGLSAQEKILPNPIHQHRLANGLNVVTVPFNSPGLAAFYIVIRVGARNEVEEGVTGFAHFFEHMMFRGTERFPKEKYSALLKSTGAAANANTSKDRTVYHVTGNAEKLETLFDLEADRFQHLKYSEHDFKAEAGAVKGEYTKNYASPYARLQEKIKETAFDDHTYEHTTMGFFKDIVDMPNQYDYSITFFRRFYRPEYCTVVVVGDVTPDRVNGLAQRYFGDWERGSFKSTVASEARQTATRYVHLQNGGVPPHLSLHYKGPAFDDRAIDMPALDILSSILFSETSDLYKKLVLKERRVRYLVGGAMDSRDPYLFSIDVSMVDKADMQAVKEEIVEAIEAVKANGVDRTVLERTQSHLKYSFAMHIDTPDRIAESLSHYIMLTGDPESLNRLYAQYDKVTVDNVKAVARQYFKPASLTIATITGNEKGGVQ